MINIRTIRKLANNDGLTLKKGSKINYKSGYQVADYGVECATPEECIKAVKSMCGNAGVWYSNGVYYVDHSFRVSTKKDAIRLGKLYNQQSILQWRSMKLIWC